MRTYSLFQRRGKQKVICFGEVCRDVLIMRRKKNRWR